MRKSGLNSARRLIRAQMLLLCLVWLAGCANSLQYRDVVADATAPRQVELSATPFHAQTAHHCGREAPAVAQKAEYLQAALGLEKAGHREAAAQAYQRAVELWPDSKNAWMSWGNNRYTAGARQEAERAYRRAIALDDAFAPAYNNLAQVLMELARWDEAERAVLQALEHSDRHEALYRQTLDEIRAARPPEQQRL
jgi:tetratricopeptide (TPR) repeat protein